MREEKRTCKACAHWPCPLKLPFDIALKCKRFQPAGEKRHIINVAGIRLPRIFKKFR